ncbi:hypothetical protein [Streptomyces sp. NPDC047043]|uniref:hypothetical protein n=1 Tax=Streptomyces sp. NPDC047043 TaxID=3154497 RepID=UPI0034017CBD
MPRTDSTELDERTMSSYWLVPMDRPGQLCKTANVLEAVLLARVLTGEDQE